MADGLEITFEGMPEFTRMMQDLQGPVASVLRGTRCAPAVA